MTDYDLARQDYIGRWSVVANSQLNFDDGRPSEPELVLLSPRLQLFQNGEAVVEGGFQPRGQQRWFYQTDPEIIMLVEELGTISTGLSSSQIFQVITRSQDFHEWQFSEPLIDTTGQVIGNRVIDWELSRIR